MSWNNKEETQITVYLYFLCQNCSPVLPFQWFTLNVTWFDFWPWHWLFWQYSFDGFCSYLYRWMSTVLMRSPKLTQLRRSVRSTAVRWIPNCLQLSIASCRYLPSSLFEIPSLYFTHKNSVVDITIKKYIKVTSVACVWASVVLANVSQSQPHCRCVSRLVAGLLPQRSGFCSYSSHVGGQIGNGTGLWSGTSVFPC
jgi:hypothetical protein